MDYKLEDIVDIPLLQELQDKLNVVYSFPSAIIDNEGKILTAVAWQDICTKFHRINPESEKECIKSDKYIMDHLAEANPAVSYQCPHGLIDNATPIIIDGKHLGNFFTGQFFLDKPDLDFFKRQAVVFGFDEKEYLEAVAKVPIWNKEKLYHYLDFIRGFIEIIAGIGLKNLKEIEARAELTRINEELVSSQLNAMNLMKEAVEAKNVLEITNKKLLEEMTERKRVEEALHKSEAQYQNIVENAPMGIFRRDLEGKVLYSNPGMIRQFECKTEKEFIENYGLITQRWIHLEKHDEYKAILLENRRVCGYENELRLVGGATKWFALYAFLDDSGQFINGFSIDITERKQTEEGLRKSEAQYRYIIENAPMGIFRRDQEGKLLYSNPGLIQQLECKTKKECMENYGLISQRWAHPEKNDEFKAILFENRRVYGYEVESRLVSGATKWFALYAFLDDSGQFINGFSIDITDRKRAEEALKQTQQLLANMFASLHDAIFILNADKVQIVDCNRGASEVFGYDREEMMGRTTEFLHVDEVALKEFREHLRRAVESQGSLRSLEFRMKRKDRTVFPTEHSVTPLKDEHGEILGWVSVVRDITERKQAEEVLRQSEARLYSILSSMNDIVFEIDLNGCFEGYFTPFNKRLYAQPDLFVGKKFDEVLPEDVCVLLRQAIESINSGNSYQQFEYHLTIDNTIQWEHAVITPRYNNSNNIIGVTAVCRNITDRKQAEEVIVESNRQLEESLVKLEETQRQVSQQEKIRSLGQMASGIAHDINNSLTPIMGYVDLLTDDKELMKRNGNSIEMILKSTRNIARTIGRLKEFYKVKLTDEDLDKLNINKVINSTIELTKHKWKDLAESTGAIIEIKKDFQDDLPLIKADESELIEAMMNLILNACDAMPNGGTLTFKTYQKESNIVIQIIDTGYGMDNETLRRCIDPFFTTKGEKGTGLGLAMAYGVIERHKGEVIIESEPGKGTCVSLILPINQEKSEDKKSNEEIMFSGSLRILGIEDDLLVSEMLKKILESRGHSVVQASDGQLGLKLFKKSIIDCEPFDLVLTDLGMPGLDGYSLSQEIKKMSPDIPIILLTGWGTLIDKEEYPKIDYLLNKPIMLEDLFHAINVLFKEKKIN